MFTAKSREEEQECKNMRGHDIFIITPKVKSQILLQDWQRICQAMKNRQMFVLKQNLQFI